MPTVTPGSKVLVTGANGFVATWVIRTLLEQGFSVRGTIRSASKGDYLKSLFNSYGDRLELVVVPDIEKVSIELLWTNAHQLSLDIRMEPSTRL